MLDHRSLREGLLELAANHRWTWIDSTRTLLDSLPGASLEVHPHETVTRLDDETIERLAADEGFVAAVGVELEDLRKTLVGRPDPRIAYCSPEFGIAGRLRQYSGGLGVLAGDHLKAASDASIPIVGVGLFYRRGFFRQEIEGGAQVERYEVTDPRQVGARDTGHVVTVPLPGRSVDARVWALEVGRVSLLLLDTDVDGNTEPDRQITDCLYGGDRAHRLEQEMVLGVGGARAVAALGLDVGLYHLNEGHAGFVTLEMIDRVITDADLDAAVEAVRPHLVFTTHTPVPAGIDRFDRDLIEPYLALWAERWGAEVSAIWQLGSDPDDHRHFNMAALALRICRSANGVSGLHGEVSRSLFAGVGMGDTIGHVTNGVHARTWVTAEAAAVFDTVAGPAWDEGAADAWEGIAAMDEGSITGIRRSGSMSLARLVEERTGHRLDPDALIVGFARRFAPYKRATLLLQRADELAELLDDEERPVHLVYAGKAHPKDIPGKEILAGIVEFAGRRGPGGGFTFLAGYDMDVARTLVGGCDIWLNTPIRPREASGTSGEKAALNGALNCSILDGWWAEMFDGENGWAIPESADADRRDMEESESTIAALRDIAAMYHGDRVAFTGRIRHSWRTLGPRVTAARMLRDYQSEVYSA